MIILFFGIVIHYDFEDSVPEKLLGIVVFDDRSRRILKQLPRIVRVYSLDIQFQISSFEVIYLYHLQLG